jgi:predicted secreted Zn-dependent protease
MKVLFSLALVAFGSLVLVGSASATTSCVQTVTTYTMVGKSAIRLDNGNYVMESTVVQDTPNQTSCDAAGIAYINLKLHTPTGAVIYSTADYKCAKTEVPLWKTTIACVFP